MCRPYSSKINYNRVQTQKYSECAIVQIESCKMHSDSIFMFVEEEMEILVQIHGVSTGPMFCFMAVQLHFFPTFAVNALK